MKAFMMLVLLAGFAALAGCRLGYDTLLFTTRTNVGLDVDSKPPTAELSISRVEGVLAPTFEQGKTPPVLASFRYGQGGLFSSRIGSTFAAGDAATVMAGLYKEPTPPNKATGLDAIDSPTGTSTDKLDSALRLSVKPMPNGRDLLQPGEVRPVFFGTTTTFGLKVGWSGMTGQFPDSLSLGYKRKELAIAPVTYKAAGENHLVETPSLLATVDVDSTITGPNDEKTRLTYLQFFATGRAATALALEQDVRKAMILRLDPNQATITRVADITWGDPAVDDALAKRIENWLAADAANVQAINQWIAREGIENSTSMTFARDPKITDEQRRSVIRDLNIP